MGRVSGDPAVPRPGTGFPAVADIARRRALGWLAFGEIFVNPTPAWVEEMRSGGFRERLEVAIGWRTGEVADFAPAMLTLGAFDRGARRRSSEQDLLSLGAAYADLADAAVLERVEGACTLLHGLTADESAAWSWGIYERLVHCACTRT